MGVAVQVNDRIGRRMRLQDLNVLMTVAESGSMGKAAQILNISQPAISRSIAELENALGVRLFDRHRQGIEPTEYGRALLNCSVAVFDDLREGVKSIEYLADPAAGEVRIGCNPFLAASFVPALVDRFSRRFPRIVIHIVTARLETLHRELNERNVDLVITRRFGSIADERMDFEFLYDEPYVIVAGLQSPWVRRRRIELAELVSEPWALPAPKSVSASVAMEAFRARGLDYPRSTVVTDNAQARIALVAAGRFLTILPSALRFPAGQPDIRVLPVEPQMAEMPVGVVTLKNRTLSPVAKLFIQHATEVAKPLVKRK